MATEWLTLDDLAAELGLHKRSVRRLIKRCQILGVRRLSLGSRTGQRKVSWTREQAEEIKRRRIEGFEP